MTCHTGPPAPSCWMREEELPLLVTKRKREGELRSQVASRVCRCIRSRRRFQYQRLVVRLGSPSSHLSDLLPSPATMGTTKVCGICGDIGYSEQIITCHRCKRNSEHTYCMKVVRFGVRDNWYCDECSNLSVDVAQESKMPHTIMESNSKAFHPLLNRVPPTKGSPNLNDQRIPKEIDDSRKWRNRKHAKHSSIPMGFYKAIQNAKVKFISTEEVCFTNHPKISFKASNSGPSSCRRNYAGSLHPSSSRGVKDPCTSSSLTKPGVFKQPNAATVYSGLLTGNVSTTRDAVIADKQANMRNKVSDGRENYVTASKRPAPEATNPLQILQIHPDEKLLNVPAPKVCWKGVFEVFDMAIQVFDEIQAHFPCQVSNKVYDISKQIPPKLKLNLLPRRDAWPFRSDIPTCYDIGLYFFAGQFDRPSDKYFWLLEQVGSKDFVMQSCLGEVELLIYPSTQLRLDSHRIAGQRYFWGVFRRKKSRKPADIANGCREAPQEQTSSCSTSLTTFH